MKSNWFGGFGSLGGFFGGMGCPACVPAVGAVFSSLGIGLTVGIAVLKWLTLGLLGLGLLGLYGNFRKHGKWIFLIVGLAASVVIFGSSYTTASDYVLYSGAAVLLINAFIDYRHTKKTKACCAVSKRK